MTSKGSTGFAPAEIPRYPRQGPQPCEPAAGGRPLKVAILHSVCYRFRMPIFRRLSAHPSLEVRIFVGTGIPGTKLSNAPDRSGIDCRILRTLKWRVNSSGRRVLLTFNPTLIWHLFRFRPDVLVVAGGMPLNNLVTLAYARATGTPIVWWSLGRVAGRRFVGLSSLYQRLNQWIEGHATCFAGFSSASIHYFRERGFPPERCFNLVNVVDTDLVRSQAAASRLRAGALREQLGLVGRNVVLFVGSLTETKGVTTLIEAYAELTPGLRATSKLLIVGDGPERPAAEKRIEDLHLSDEVLLIGAVYEGVEDYFQLGNLLVLPGTGGLAISEGMAHGLPVICSIGDGVEVDLIDEGMNGYRVEPDSPEQLAQRMQAALEDPRRLEQMGAHSLRIIDERANIDDYRNEMLSAIRFAADARPHLLN